MQFSPSQKKTIQYQFDSFCRKIMRAAHHDYLRSLRRRLEVERQLEESMLDQYAEDEVYPSDLTWFRVMEYHVAIRNERLADALAELLAEKRETILLAFFIGMTDAEIASRCSVVRTTIQRRRNRSLQELRNKMKGGQQ
ncbi:sigma-70 family RNA polymerase sigma factor [Dysosmobacter sp.]